MEKGSTAGRMERGSSAGRMERGSSVGTYREGMFMKSTTMPDEFMTKYKIK